jgi:hypothetical protein
VRRSSGALEVSKRERGQAKNEHMEDEIVLLVGEKTVLGKEARS